MSNQTSTISLGCNLQYQVHEPTSLLIHISTALNPFQNVVSEQINCSSAQPLEFCNVGPLGNRLQRVLADPGDLSISYQGTIELQQEVVDSQNVQEATYPDLPHDVLRFLNPSRYCESDRLSRFAAAEFGNVDRGHSRVRTICQWINERLSYTPGSTDASTTACDVLLQRTGVCRDYAHVGISLCRALGIPARYVSGYAVDLQPPDFHGFFEAYLGDRWYLFDATNLAPIGGLVRIGTGRDAADVAFATIIGNATLENKEVWAYESNEGEQVPSLPPDNVGVSTAE